MRWIETCDTANGVANYRDGNMAINIQILVERIPQERKADALRLWGISLLEEMLAALDHSKIADVLPCIENVIFSLKHSDEKGLRSAAYATYAANAALAAAYYAAYAAYAATNAAAYAAAYAAYAATHAATHAAAYAAYAATHAATHAADAAKKEIQGNISFLVLAG